jgi:competence protein ComEA
MTRLGSRACAALAATLLIVPIVAGAATASSKAASAPSPAASKPAAQPKLVDINSASKAELKTLQGIGDAEAEKIIAGRPYLSKADLVTKGLIPAGIYQSNRHRIIALPPAKGTPQAKPHEKS